jgi:hypothetical protein
MHFYLPKYDSRYIEYNTGGGYFALVQDKQITCVLLANACCTVYVNLLWNTFKIWKQKLRENARWNVNKTVRCLVRNKIKHRKKYSHRYIIIFRIPRYDNVWLSLFWMTRTTKYICCFSRNDQLFFHIFNSQEVKRTDQLQVMCRFTFNLGNRQTSGEFAFRTESAEVATSVNLGCELCSLLNTLHLDIFVVLVSFGV